MEVVTTSSPTPRRERQKSRGATMVEFAIVASALFTLIFGILEGGFAVRARNAINNSTDEAARRGAVAGTRADADYQILNTIVQRGSGAADIQYVVIYRSTGGGDAVPAGCVDGSSQPGVCNVYYPDENGNFNLNPGDYGCPSGLGTQWCPSNRIAGDDIAFLGVYVRADYEPIINQIFFEFDFNVNADSVQALETSGVLTCVPASAC